MERDLKENPWKGLASYTYQDADHFFGRDKELDEIASIIKQNAFTTLYGVSGAGKTSIINAGLFPILDKLSYLPIYIRLDHNQGHIGYDSQIINAVNTALNAIDAELEESIGSKEIHSELDELWLYFHSHQFWTKDNHKITPIIFIDQFEEIFTKNDNPDDIWSFFNIIDSLQYSTPTERLLQIIEHNDQYVQFHEEQNFRMVFTMREDFLARLEDYSYNIPALRKSRIGLKPLNGLQALDVILRPRPDMVTRDVALHIISKITGKNITDNARRLETTSVDTSLLSLFCTELYNYAVNDNKGTITIPLVDLYGGNILEWFYDRNMQILPKKTYIYLENQLLTHSGFRNSVALENLLENGVQQEQLDRLAENRIIRIEDVNNNYRVEFTHDVLCKIAKKHRDERDKLMKSKNEDSAKRAFTIDNVILFSAFFFQFLAFFFGGFNPLTLLVFATLPFVLILYLMIVHRTIADRNFSNAIWFIIAILGMAGGIIALSSLINQMFGEHKYIDRIFIGLLTSLLFSIILLPFIMLILIEQRQQNKKSTILEHHPRLFYLFVLIIQGVLVGLGYSTSLKEEPYRIFLICLPSIAIALTPFYYLYRNIRDKKTHKVTIYTCVYSLYIFLSFILFKYKENLFTDSRSESHLVAQAIIWGTIGVMCAFYGIQYMKQPKDIRFSDYWNNVLSFQSFNKYKSFKTRLTTIIVCFLIIVIGAFSAYYNDIFPFIALPVISLLVLHITGSEFKTTTKKNAFTFRLIIPMLVISSAIVSVQYYNGLYKPWIIYIAGILMTVLCFIHLIKKENLQNRTSYVFRALFVATFIGFVLPVICIGYNIYNPAIFNVSRVWGGKVSSDVRNFYLLTIQDREGNKGIMDYTDIIIPPQFQEIEKFCSIDYDIAKDCYPMRMSIIELFDNYHKGNTEPEFQRIAQFGVSDSQGKHLFESNNFITYYNKYGRYYMKSWVNYGLHPTDRQKNFYVLSSINKCISDKDRNIAFNKLFVISLAEISCGNDDITYRYHSPEDDIEILLSKCYHYSSIEILAEDVNCILFDDLYNAAMKTDYLFACDKTGKFSKYFLDECWNLFSKYSTNHIALEDKAYFYLLSGRIDQAESYSLNTLKKYPKSTNMQSNYCLLLFSKGKIAELKKNLIKVIPSFNKDQRLSFYMNVASKSLHLEQYNLMKNRDNLMRMIELYINIDKSTKNDFDVAIQTEDYGNLNELAYHLASLSCFESAMLCIDRAIQMNCLDANLYDSRGEILLKQGRIKEAQEMVGKVFRHDSDFFNNNYSALYEYFDHLDKIDSIQSSLIDDYIVAEEAVEWVEP